MKSKILESKEVYEIINNKKDKFKNKEKEYEINEEIYIKEQFYRLGCWAFKESCCDECICGTEIIAFEDDIETYDICYKKNEYDLEEAKEMKEKESRLKVKIIEVEEVEKEYIYKIERVY